MPLTLDSYDKDKHADALRPGLRLNPMDGTGAKISEEETDAVIRDLMSGQTSAEIGCAPIPRGSARKMAMPRNAPQEEMAQPAPRRRPVRKAPEAEAVPMAPAPGTAPREEPAPERVANGIYAESFEPLAPATEPGTQAKRDRRWVRPALFGAVVAAAILRPWLVLLPLFLAFWAVMITVAVLGGGSLGEGFGRVYRRMKARNPARAEKMRARMDRIAMRWDDLLDRMPGSWADNLALPDFSDAALDPQIGAGRPDPFERLA